MRTSRRTNKVGPFFARVWCSTRLARFLVIIGMLTAPWVIPSNVSASPMLPPEPSQVVLGVFGDMQFGTGAVVALKQEDIPLRPQGSDILNVSAVSTAPAQDDSCQGNSQVCGAFPFLGPLGALFFLFMAGSGGHGSTAPVTSSFDAVPTPLSPVPEPSSLLLFFSGLGGASGFLWRRRRGLAGDAAAGAQVAPALSEEPSARSAA